MRGIAFIGGQGPEYSRCRSLAEGADLIVAADSGLISAEGAGLCPRWIIGDMDSLDSLRRLDKYPRDRIIRYPHEKDYTDTELALELLRKQGCEEVWLIGGGGGRLDHLLAIRSLFEREKGPDRWVTSREDCRLVKGDFTFSLERGSRVSVFPLGSDPWKISSSGLKWPLDKAPWDRGFAGISNVSVDGQFSVNAASGRFLVIVELSAVLAECTA
jgi:thiamine pyrophosphokinase